MSRFKREWAWPDTPEGSGAGPELWSRRSKRHTKGSLFRNIPIAIRSSEKRSISGDKDAAHSKVHRYGIRGIHRGPTYGGRPRDRGKGTGQGAHQARA